MSDVAVLRATVLEGIEEVARRHLHWQGAVRREMRLVEDLELDSMRLFVLAAEVENHFRIALDEADELRLVTVGDLADLILRKLTSRDQSEPSPSG
ncbi:MAG: acyl carrier protein [Acidobacteriota bacterium]|nr:acyl carrier protein [Acidobacteriota bacterium]